MPKAAASWGANPLFWLLGEGFVAPAEVKAGLNPRLGRALLPVPNSHCQTLLCLVWKRFELKGLGVISKSEHPKILWNTKISPWWKLWHPKNPLGQRKAGKHRIPRGEMDFSRFPSSCRAEFAKFSWIKGKGLSRAWIFLHTFRGNFVPFFPDRLWVLVANGRKTGTNRWQCKTRSGISSHGSSLLPACLQNPGSIPNPGIYSLLITVEMFKCFAGWDSGGIFSFCGAFGNPREGFFILGCGMGTSRMGENQGGSQGSPGEGKSLEWGNPGQEYLNYTSRFKYGWE